jgi:hypothetical protein
MLHRRLIEENANGRRVIIVELPAFCAAEESDEETCRYRNADANEEIKCAHA